MNRTLSVAVILAALVTLPLAWWSGGNRLSQARTSGPVLGTTVDPAQVVGLRLAGWQEIQRLVRTIELRLGDGGWSIPAAAGITVGSNDRASILASRFLGLRFGRLVTRDPARHAGLRLLDPLATWPTGTDLDHAVGYRVTVVLQDGSAGVDFIFGAVVANAGGRFYARLADSDEVYTAAFDPMDVAFTLRDFIEPDPARLRGQGWTRLEVIPPPPAPRIEFRHSDDAGWVSPSTPPGYLPTPVVTQGMPEELQAPAVCGAELRTDAALAARGIFRGPDGLLHGRGGSLVASTKAGLQVTCLLGDPVQSPGCARFQGAPAAPLARALAYQVDEVTPGTTDPALLARTRQALEGWIWHLEENGCLRLVPPPMMWFMDNAAARAVAQEEARQQEP